MDRFSKTTEIDTAEITAATMEDNAPKKSKATNVIALVLCLLIAIVVWVSVMETDTEFEHDYDDILVYSQSNADAPIDMVSVVLKGARKNIVDIKADDIILVVDSNGKYVAQFTNESLSGLVLSTNVGSNGDIVITVISK